MSLRKIIKTHSSFPTDDAGDQAVLSCAEQRQQEMDDANTGLESCVKSVYYPARRPDATAVMKFRLHKILDTLLASATNPQLEGYSRS